MSAEVHRDEFVKLVNIGNEYKCIKYINKYNDFYDTKYCDLDLETDIANILIYVCKNKLSRVAIALIDKKCNLTYQDNYGYTALMMASLHELHDVVTHIINNSQDTTTRCLNYGNQFSEMIYLCYRSYNNNINIIKMIDRGYDIYYKVNNSSLFTAALQRESTNIVEKLMDKDINFADEFKTYCKFNGIEPNFYNTIVKYINGKHDTYKHTIIATMDDASPANALYQSFHTTYAVGLVDIICDFIVLRMGNIL
ncbi:MAG: hypothetical protein Faunusvirus25_8 [Faunusvirus sp.]|jgi:hypothetical protein|uniref:Ankyrin repeat protein n=1 Tax=Faunusvirus sp. TaxID=2487766 RepID=A0A3G4ZXL5_9VIRU|nr:MAG: hypothetical protein Faunusvirus25_8 [Faunusvirus sp.]